MSSSKVRAAHPLMRYHGGKWRIAPKIIEFFPQHQLYVEPFGGAGSVLLRKAPIRHEVYNDLDLEMFNLMSCLRDRRSELIEAIHFTPFAEKSLLDLYEVAETDNPIERARRILVKAMMGRATASATQNFKATFRGISVSSKEIRNHSDEWARYEETLWNVGTRLRTVVLRNANAEELIRELDTKEALFYVDPPYVPGERDKGNDYRHELSLQEHESLAETLNSVQGQVVLSGYQCEQYTTWYENRGWRRHDFKALSDNAGERVESVWLSPNIRQSSLF